MRSQKQTAFSSFDPFGHNGLSIKKWRVIVVDGGQLECFVSCALLYLPWLFLRCTVNHDEYIVKPVMMTHSKKKKKDNRLALYGITATWPE